MSPAAPSSVPPLPSPPGIARIEPGRITPALVAALRTGAVAARAPVAVVALRGP